MPSLPTNWAGIDDSVTAAVTLRQLTTRILFEVLPDGEHVQRRVRQH